jgi:hypothetical protein
MRYAHMVFLWTMKNVISAKIFHKKKIIKCLLSPNGDKQPWKYWKDAGENMLIIFFRLVNIVS